MELTASHGGSYIHRRSPISRIQGIKWYLSQVVMEETNKRKSKGEHTHHM